MVTRRRTDNLPRQKVAVTDDASTHTLFHIGVLTQPPSLPDEEIARLGEAAYYHFETAGQGISHESETLWQKNVYEALGAYTFLANRVRRLVADSISAASEGVDPKTTAAGLRMVRRALGRAVRTLTEEPSTRRFVAYEGLLYCTVQVARKATAGLDPKSLSQGEYVERFRSTWTANLVFVTQCIDASLGFSAIELARLLLEDLSSDAESVGELRGIFSRAAERVARRAAEESEQQQLPDVFRNGYATVPTNHAAHALVRAIQDGGENWTDHEGETVPTYIMPTNRGLGSVRVTLRGPDGDQVAAATTLPVLWDKVRGLDDLTSDTLLAVLARWATLSAGPTEPVWISADAVLDDRGIQRMRYRSEARKWQHGHRREDRMAVGKALARLENLWLQIIDVQVIPMKGRRRAKSINMASRALAMLDVWSETDLLDGETVFLQARVMPGQWAQAYWDHGLRQTGLLAQRALMYDVYRERVEKRLAKYLAFQFRINAHRKVEVERLKVTTLLDNGGLRADERFPGRTRDRLESALKRLCADGVIAEWDYVENPVQVLPARGWLKDWLQMTIWIELPEVVAEHYASLRPTGRALAAGGRGVRSDQVVAELAK